ncbi:MAG: hypothetical protein Ct9H300mP1_38210 [Planctomycetaceae bacterium]|nr:MAG: hypothetical protein Ct9H300mP1_38210 [Planctomycetaceae bacterium]
MSRMLGCLLCLAPRRSSLRKFPVLLSGRQSDGFRPPFERPKRNNRPEPTTVPAQPGNNRKARRRPEDPGVHPDRSPARPHPTSLASHLGLTTGRGMRVRAVLPESPADQEQRLRRFDIILSVDGKPLIDPSC